MDVVHPELIQRPSCHAGAGTPDYAPARLCPDGRNVECPNTRPYEAQAADARIAKPLCRLRSEHSGSTQRNHGTCRWMHSEVQNYDVFRKIWEILSLKTKARKQPGCSIQNGGQRPKPLTGLQCRRPNCPNGTAMRAHPTGCRLTHRRMHRGQRRQRRQRRRGRHPLALPLQRGELRQPSVPTEQRMLRMSTNSRQ